MINLVKQLKFGNLNVGIMGTLYHYCNNNNSYYTVAVYVPCPLQLRGTKKEINEQKSYISTLGIIIIIARWST